MLQTKMLQDVSDNLWLARFIAVLCCIWQARATVANQASRGNRQPMQQKVSSKPTAVTTR